MSNALLTILESRLSSQAKALAAYIIAFAGDSRTLLQIPCNSVTTALGIGESRLRSYRAELTSCGVMGANQDGPWLLVDFNWQITPEQIEAGLLRRSEARTQRAQSARVARAADETARQARGADETARVARAVDAPDRARSARYTRCPESENPRAEREDYAPATPHTPPQGINLTRTDGWSPSSPPDPRVRATLGRSRDLLTAAGLSTRVAADLAAALSLEHIARVVARWQIDRDAGHANGLGALKYRLEHPDEWPPRSDLTWPDMQTGVLAEHVTEQDLRAWRFHKPHNPLAAYDAPAGYEGIVKH